MTGKINQARTSNSNESTGYLKPSPALCHAVLPDLRGTFIQEVVLVHSTALMGGVTEQVFLLEEVQINVNDITRWSAALTLFRNDGT